MCRRAPLRRAPALQPVGPVCPSATEASSNSASDTTSDTAEAERVVGELRFRIGGVGIDDAAVGASGRAGDLDELPVRELAKLGEEPRQTVGKRGLVIFLHRGRTGQ